MDARPGEPVPSGSMEATPAIDPRALGGVSAPGTNDAPGVTGPAVPAPGGREADPDAAQMSLVRRLRQPRTIISIAVPLFIIAAFVGLNGRPSRRSPR